MAVQTSIYDNEIYFGITFRGQTLLILEPDGWDKISNRIPRDPKWWGFWSDFLEDKYGMRFTFIKDGGLTGGGELLKEIAETIGYGPDTEVYFEVGIKKVNTLQQIHQWRINLNEYNCENPGGVLTSIEKMPFQAKLRARMAAPCTVNTYSTMDGNVLTPISTSSIRLHSKTLLLETKGVSSSPQTSNDYFDNTGDGNPLVMQPDQSNLTINQLLTVFTQPIGLLNIGSVTPSTPSPIATGYPDFVKTTDMCQLIVQYSGLLTIKVNATFDWWYWHRGFEYAPAGGASGWSCNSRMAVVRVVAGVKTIVHSFTGTVFGIDSTSPGHVWPATAPSGILPMVTGGDRDFCNKTPNIVWNETYSDIAVEAGDEVFVSFILQPVGVITDLILITVQATNFLGTIEYSQFTTTPGTTADGFRIIDVLNHLTENITGFKNAVISNFFSEGGGGWKYLLANGYSIRNFGGPAYKFKKDLESLLIDLQSIFCLGIGIKRVNLGMNQWAEYMVIEPVSEFMKNRTIGIYTDTYDWKNKISNQYCFNKANIGYQKYEGLNIQQQDEFCTQGQYLNQGIRTFDNTLETKSNLIASGYVLEVQRRNQFLANPQQSLTNDEDIFIVATAEPCVFDAALTNGGLPWATILDNATSRVGFTMNSMALQKGDTFVTSTGSNAGTVFTIVEESPGYPVIGLDVYVITPAPVNEILNTTVTITPVSPEQVFAERNQPFKICEGVVDPSTIYNGRIALKNILYNWRPIFGIGLYFIDPASTDYRITQIVTTLVKMNSLFTHKFLTTEPNKGFIGDNTVTELRNEVVRSYLNSGDSLFTPLGAECKIRIGWNEMDTIRKALCGELGDDTKDFGGVVLRDDFGIDWFCHIMDIQYDLVKEIATLYVQKVKRVTL